MRSANRSGNGAFSYDALPLEHKLQEGSAFRHVDVADFVNNPAGLRLFRPTNAWRRNSPSASSGPIPVRSLMIPDNSR